MKNFFYIIAISFRSTLELKFVVLNKIRY